MIRARALSPHAKGVLDAFAQESELWRHGYDLARLTGLKTGTLYPLLIRLEAQGYLEAEWQQPAGPGRPPRHAYRLTPAGLQLARNAPEPQAAATRWGRREART